MESVGENEEGMNDSEEIDGNDKSLGPEDLPIQTENPRELSLAQQLLLKQYSDQVKTMSAEECSEMAMSIVRQIMLKENMLKQMLNRDLDFGDNIPSPFEFIGKPSSISIPDSTSESDSEQNSSQNEKSTDSSDNPDVSH
eukprot:CAMPEP_0182449386 /NCGR_PEP_ID=MMETSP1172-20130603/33968_1 /TAXON_ID=708627 /ORGANISM="Timspurckia oligopyrenoides, Strain CCMP3278" /LENGTH=139 /DNA_ID=CAMNT_0024646647 /DNA_START=162 /DNA_END=578 /DNA_ORIENTATION=+